MHLTPSRDPQDNALRAARAAVLSGEPIPTLVQERLYARGIDVSALEQRLIQTQEFRA